MWENMTYETILDDMLSRVTSDVDKREGSVIYDALAPCAYQLAQNYFLLNNFLDLVSGDTAVGEYLDRVVADYGLVRKPPSYAIREIRSSGPINIGTRWGLNIDNDVEVYNDRGELVKTRNLPYKIIESIGVNTYSAICEYAGIAGHIYTGQLENIDNVSGIVATIEGIVASGYDSETDENLRLRLYAYLQRPSTSGNVFNYREWAMSVPGVGAAKVFPLWNGNGSVKVLIVDNNMEADETLEPVVLEYIESVRPIGANITVDSPGGREISISAELALDGTSVYEDVKNSFISGITKYLKSLVFETYIVSYAKIGSILLSTSGVADYSNLIVNGGTENVMIYDDEMPVLGSVSLEVP